MNLVYLTYDFKSRTVLLEYYVEDHDHANMEVNLTELTELLTNTP